MVPLTRLEPFPMKEERAFSLQSASGFEAVLTCRLLWVPSSFMISIPQKLVEIKIGEFSTILITMPESLGDFLSPQFGAAVVSSDTLLHLNTMTLSPLSPFQVEQIDGASSGWV